jgi:NAD(P)-dependent dehydrogenase (short-subunit alcohol dehydrogenase family)
MDLGLTDRVAIVTGTASQKGMGKAISLTLAKEGAHIVSCDINLEGAKKTADAVKALGRKAIAIKVDIADRAEVGDMVEAALAEFGKIDILVNTAGLHAGGGTFLESTKEYWDKDIGVNLYGTMNCCQAVLPSMVERKYGKIVNFSSLAARIGEVLGAYSAAKGGIITFTMGLGAHFGPSGINVNAIAPGLVLTEFYGDRLTPEMEKGFIAAVPMKRVVTVEDIANATAFLVSDVSSAITGQTFDLDCGRTLL